MMKHFVLIMLVSILIIVQNLTAKKSDIKESTRNSIVQQLNSHFGKNYEIDEAIIVDSTNWDVGRLENCIVFTATIAHTHRNGESIVGVYRDNQIIWYSDFIIPGDKIYGGGYIDKIGDINNDGKVEIMTQWESEGGATFQTITLFVHSWDGEQGKLAIDTSDGESPILSYGGMHFDYIDVNGDGIFEIISYWTDSIPTVIEWNGTNYTYSTIELETTEMFFPKNNFTPFVNTKVNKVDDKYLYNYSVQNSNISAQSITEFDVYGFDDYSIIYGSIDFENSDVTTKAQNWDGYRLGTSVVWSGYPMKPGDSLGGFSYRTIGLPTISYAYLRGYNYQWGGDYIDNTSVDDYLNNSVIVQTIAAKIPPTPFVPSNFLDTLKSYTDSSAAYGWIKTEQARDKYNTYFNNAKMYLQQGDSSSAKGELQLVLADCVSDSSTVLTSEAYALLYFNTEYLIEQLPETNNRPINSLSGTIELTVTETEVDNSYTYRVTNSDTSSQSIENVYVSSIVNDELLTAPIGWLEVTETFAYNLAGFNSETEPILAGNSQDGFTISTKGLPTIGNVYLQSERSVIDSTDIFTNSYLVETVVPKKAPSDFEAIAFIDTLLSYNSRSLEKEWLSASWVLTVLKSSLDNARLMIDLNQPQSSLPIMEQFNVILASYQASNFITDEAYYLLKPNSSYLITKLDSLINAPQNVDAFALLDTVFAANEKNNNDGWYPYTWVYTNFTAMLNNAKITLEQNNPLGCKGVMEGFVSVLDAYKTSGFVTEEGHSYLKPKCLDLIEELSN